MSKNLDKVEAYKKIKNFYKNGHGYHTLKFPDGTVVKGKFDMSKYLEFYKIPDDLSGKTILEIGPANGFFSFELYKRGAKKVVAIDTSKKWWIEELNFLMNTKVEHKVQSLTTIDESFGKFDIVFSSNVLQHLSDLYGNIERIRKLTKYQAILATTVLPKSKSQDIPMARFIGKTQEDEKGKRVTTFWRPNMTCFRQLAEAAGFSKVEEISFFEISRDDKQTRTPCGVIHCYV